MLPRKGISEMRVSLLSVAFVATLTAGLVGLPSLARIQDSPDTRVPRIWDDTALQDWATPVAGLNVRPSHYSSAEYYAVPADNLATYPVYRPDREPAGYWENLQKRAPQPLVDVSAIRTDTDWIAAGKRAFETMDSLLVRTDDPQLIALLRDPASFEGKFTLPDGSVVGPRWVVTSRGLMVSITACANCHVNRDPDRGVVFGGPGSRADGGQAIVLNTYPLLGAQGTGRRLRLFYTGDPVPVGMWREFTTPWSPDERVERFKTMSAAELQQLSGANQLGRAFGGGVFARTNGSPYYGTKIMDLQNLKYSRYVDATGTHRLRGPEDIARYAALVTGADRMEFGPHRILAEAQQRVRYRYADEVLYAIGKYLISLEPPKNPSPGAPDLIKRGEGVFNSQGCVNCHVPPAYTSGKLTLAQGWQPDANHPNREDVVLTSVGTDPGLALRTRKGTGFYKIPSLRGVWYRPLLLHDGAVASLEEMFDPARLDADYEPKGWNPPGTDKRAIPGHMFGLRLDAQEKAALLAFLRSL